MADLFSPFTLKGVTLRNRIVMSPMTMYRSATAGPNDFHVMHMGARAAGGFGLVFPEQIAITPDGRTTTRCGGLYDEDQVEGWTRAHRHGQGHGWRERDPARATPAARAARSPLGGRAPAASRPPRRLGDPRAVGDALRR